MLQRPYTAVPRRRSATPAAGVAGKPVQPFRAATVTGVLFASLAMTAALLHHAGLVVTLWSRGNLPYLLAACLIFAVRSDHVTRGWRHAGALRTCTAYFAVFTLMALTGAVASYPIAAMTQGFADPSLQRIDVAMGFDWLHWYRTVAAHPVLQWLGLAAYQTIYLTPAVLLAWFSLTGQRGEAHRFLAGFWLAAVITLALFALMPAVGPLSYLWHAPIDYMPVSEIWQSGLIPALRAHTVHSIELDRLRGLVSAPSFHAAAGTLYLRTAWRIPSLRRPLTAVVVAMLVATPVEGTHYLIDMVLGAGVALFAMEAVDMVMRRRPRPV